MDRNSEIITEISAQANQDSCQFVKIEKEEMPAFFWRGSKISPHWHAVGFITLQLGLLSSSSSPSLLSEHAANEGRCDASEHAFTSRYVTLASKHSVKP